MGRKVKNAGSPTSQVTEDYTPSDGQRRTVTLKKFPNEVRVYRVFGDVTDAEALGEIAQHIAIRYGVERVTFQW